MPLPRTLRLLGLVSVLFATSAASAGPFRAVPALDGRATGLKIRWVRYNGGTNGAMTVEIKNTGAGTSTFTADGLYFVPRGDPETAPQRLGAAGPLQTVGNHSRNQRVESLALQPGEARTVSLDVFCIDSHRSSPNSNTRFVIADRRMPKKLRTELKTSNQAIYRKHKGKAATKAAKSEVQSNMWKVRDKNWVELQGERKREKSPRPGHWNRNQSPRQQRQAPAPRQRPR